MARESSHIVPPSGLRVNRKSAVPVHVQLQTQVRHLIDTGALKPGMQLQCCQRRHLPRTYSQSIVKVPPPPWIYGRGPVRCA